MTTTIHPTSATLTTGGMIMPPRAAKIMAMGIGHGKIAMVEIQRPMKVRKGEAPIEKWSKWQVRIGCNYENLNAVKEARQDGTLPEEPHGISGAEWFIFPILVRYIKANELGLRMYSLPDGKGFPPKYLRDGKEITEEQARAACLASEFYDNKNNPGMCYAPKINNIISINNIPL
jgi:hypothetical protein